MSNNFNKKSKPKNQNPSNEIPENEIPENEIITNPLIDIKNEVENTPQPQNKPKPKAGSIHTQKMTLTNFIQLDGLHNDYTIAYMYGTMRKNIKPYKEWKKIYNDLKGVK